MSLSATSKRAVIIGCFFLSGAAGLVFEVVWARQLGLFLGITSFAHTAVITAYMAGLAAGSLVFGRIADRSPNPLRLYARIELGICLYAMTTPWLFDALQSAYAGLGGVAGVIGMPGHLARFAIAMAALLLPTFLMGGTLPLLVRGFTTELAGLGESTGRLYGINTLGAMCGTLLAGFFLLPKFGITLAILAGALINLAVAITVLSLVGPGDRRLPRVRGEADEHAGRQAMPVRGRADRAAILVAFAIAGFSSLLTQLAWIRALIMVVGGSVYAFTTTLAAFLAGIGLGSLAYARLLAPRLSGVAMRDAAAIIAVIIAFTLLLGLPLIQQLPPWYLSGFEKLGPERFGLFQAFIFALAFAVMIVPTLLMGVLFPLVTVMWTRSADSAARGVGAAYAINTAGTILGALLGGLLILPATGVHNGIQLAASLYVIGAVLFWWRFGGGRFTLRRAAAVAVVVPVFIVSAMLLPSWDRMLMGSGAYYRANDTVRLVREAGFEALFEGTELLYYEEGLDGTVTVKRDETGERSLAVNGKTDASSSGDLPTQVMLGQYPLRMNRDIHDAMVIGLGSGITAAAIAAEPDIRSLEVLEISREVVEASDFFRPENHDVLDDPRVHLITADARNYLLATPRRYDLIVSEPSNPWISGVSNLFTKEFFELARNRLRPGGLLTQWFHIYNMSLKDFRSVLGAIGSVFEHVSVWRTLPGDLVIVASDQPHGLMLDTVPWADSADPVVQELNRAGMYGDHDLVQRYLVGGLALKQFVAGARPNTDRHPVVEFNAPRNLYADSEGQNLEALYGFLGGRDLSVPVERLLLLGHERIESPAFGVDIALHPGQPPQIRSAHWLLAHARFADGSWGQGSQRRLVWEEDGEGLYLQASRHEQPPAYSEQVALLASLVVGEPQFSGDIEIEGAIAPAAWSLHAEPDTGRLRLGLSWACMVQDQPGIVNRYAAARSIPAQWHERQEYILETFAARFRCH